MGNRSFAARLQQLFSAHDMTQGAPWKRILEFAIPMLIGNLAQQLYNTADSIIVGRYVGDNALAAVGSASPSSTSCLRFLWASPQASASW